MQVSHLYNLKPKLHLKALSFLSDKGIFCGVALGYVDYTGLKPLHRLLRKIWKLKMKYKKTRTQTMKMKKWRKVRTQIKSKYLGKVFYL